ncbi:hypothetical protein [Arcanobacterium hippocoleae]|uniref:FtsH-binding integral membrane protein n=1 Tax=Arcanobacterium hippocoleae TaxID=149017 RepID=A0ABU1T1Z1_9ACTO|nr:hypothetical protein [Arcanobacterium hippocoleae]MDR6939398.1 FtsH-binding integral membrane protein [Arcanobacterium hippocoleae]
MKQLQDQHSVLSKVATLMIFIAGALATAIGTFEALNQPVLPLWSVSVAFLFLIAGCAFAGKRMAGVSAPWAYLVDLAVSVLIGFTCMAIQEHVANNMLGVRIWRFILVGVMFFVVSGYFYKRHPSAPQPVSEESTDQQ